MNNDFRSILRTLAGILLLAGNVGILYAYVTDRPITTYVWALFLGGLTIGAALFRGWPRLLGLASNGLAHAGRRAAPHINAGAQRAAGAVGQNPLKYATIAVGILTLVFFGIAISKESLGWFQAAVIFTFLTIFLAVTYYDGWGDVEMYWERWLLVLLLLGFPLTFVFGGGLDIAIGFLVAALVWTLVLLFGPEAVLLKAGGIIWWPIKQIVRFIVWAVTGFANWLAGVLSCEHGPDAALFAMAVIAGAFWYTCVSAPNLGNKVVLIAGITTPMTYVSGITAITLFCVSAVLFMKNRLVK